MRNKWCASRERACDRGGFTLLEMLLVVTIMTIGTAMALPKIRTIITRQHVDRAAQIVASDIRSAFTSAARGRIPVRLTIPVNATAYAVTNRVTGDTIVRRNFATGDLSVASLSASIITIDVFPNGVASSPDTITLSGADGYQRKLAVSRVGFVRVLP